MAHEIERKFLVTATSYRELATKAVNLEQAYLSRFPAATVRLRIVGDDKAYLTIKAANHGVVREEWEYEIPVADARHMLDTLPVSARLSKTRYYVGPWEVDEFHGRLAGLTVAEIELDSADSPVPDCGFIGREVSDDHRYYNSSLGDCDSLPPTV